MSVDLTMRDLSDGKLLTLYVERNDASALKELVTRHAPFVMRVGTQMLFPAQGVDDVCQIVFLKLIEKGPQIKNRDCLSSWLYSVTQRTVQEYRRESSKVSLPGKLDPMSNEQPIEDREQLSILHEEMEKLPLKYREPLLLCDLQNLSRQAVAEMLKTTEAAVKARLARGRKLLKQRLLVRGVTFASVLVMWHASSVHAADYVAGPLVEQLMQQSFNSSVTGVGQAPANYTFSKGGMRWLLPLRKS
ncbi:MAG: sigma-70 family RNA polymerase sigma factor [Planctomycetaceae bacterium]